MTEIDSVREDRIYNEVVVDVYGSGERAMGWYYYLDDKISFPFNAECVDTDKRAPLEKGERLTVIGLSGEDYCEHAVLVNINWMNKTLAVPLAILVPIGVDGDTDEAISDWHYWKKCGYLF